MTGRGGQRHRAGGSVVVTCLALLLGACRSDAGGTGRSGAEALEPYSEKYKPASAEQAAALGRAIAAAYADGQPEQWDAALDVNDLGLRVMRGLNMDERYLKNFLAGFERGAGGSFGASIKAGLGDDSRLTFLRTREVKGQRRAILRAIGGDGSVNYYDLVVGVDAAQNVKVTDIEIFMNGQLLSETVREATLPLLKEVRRSWIDRLLGRDTPGLAYAMKDVPRIRKLVLEGEPAEAMAVYDALPEKFRRSRLGLLLRIQCAQGLGDEEYADALAALDAAFPDDPSLALTQVDRYYLRKDWQGAARALQQVSRGIGGDAYLDVLLVNVYVEQQDLEQAKKFADAAVAAEPDLPEAWWSLVNVSLAAQDHAEVARLLIEIEHRFELEFVDLEDVEEYSAFVASDAYLQWLERPQLAASLDD